MAGCAFSVLVSYALVPDSMTLVRGSLSVSSISSRMGFAVPGKASSHGAHMPTRWTPWPIFSQYTALLSTVGNHEKAYQEKRWPSLASWSAHLVRCSSNGGGQAGNYLPADRIAYTAATNAGPLWPRARKGWTWRKDKLR